MAYAALGTCYGNLGETGLAAENTRKAYELRQGLSEREKLYIETHYSPYVTGNLENARQFCDIWAQTYPRDFLPSGTLTYIYANLGQRDKALEKAREVLRLQPASGLAYSNLVQSYLSLGRLQEARTSIEEAQAKNLDSPELHFYRYIIAFLENDTVGMEQQVALGTQAWYGNHTCWSCRQLRPPILGDLVRLAWDHARRAMARGETAGIKKKGKPRNKCRPKRINIWKRP